MNTHYQRANIFKAVIYFLFSRKRYIDLAVDHGMALNLEAKDQLKRAEEGGESVLKGWEENYRSGYINMTMTIRKALWEALAFIMLVAFIAVLVGINFGKISSSLSIDYMRIAVFLGTFLTGWATLMELGGSLHTWDGGSLPELTHQAIFKVLFVPGVCLIFVGILM